MLASSHSRNGRSRISPYLMTSARPARNSLSGKVFSVSVSASTTPRLVKRTYHVFAQRMVDAGFAAD